MTFLGPRTQAVNMSQCPTCYRPFREAGALRPGDMGVCFYCAAAFGVGPEHEVVELAPGEVADLPEKVRRGLRLGRKVVREHQQQAEAV